MKKKSFTLIELLVVIGIIAALAAIVMPNAFKAIEKAKLEQKGSARKANELLNENKYPYVSNQVKPLIRTRLEANPINLDPYTIAKNRYVCMFESAPEIEFYRALRLQILLISI